MQFLNCLCGCPILSVCMAIKSAPKQMSHVTETVNVAVALFIRPTETFLNRKIDKIGRNGTSEKFFINSVSFLTIRKTMLGIIVLCQVLK